MKKAIWLSYDLGFKGDYPGLYRWLDTQNAIECGTNLAYFNFDIDKEEELFDKLASDIKKSVSLMNGERFYAVSKQDAKMKGKYIIGNRKANPWEGYGEIGDNNEDGE